MSDDGWTTLRAERRYRGCLLHVASLDALHVLARVGILRTLDAPLSTTTWRSMRKALVAAGRPLDPA
jgi:hypothetical protein